jgi:hypothetical protein
MWFTSLALAAGPLDAGHVELASHATAHPGRYGAHQLLAGGSLTVRPWKALGLRLDGDVGLVGPRHRGDELGAVNVFEAEPSDRALPPGEAVDAAMFVEPAPFYRFTRTTALLSSQVVLTPLRVGLGSRDLAFDLGVGAGTVHTADRPRPAKDTWSRVVPEPTRAQWHLAPVASVGARLGLTEHVGAQLQARGLTWTETFSDGGQDRIMPVWLTAGLCGSLF